MTSLDEQIEAVSALLRTHGGRVEITPDAPDEIKRAWLNMILECPRVRDGVAGEMEGVMKRKIKSMESAMQA